MKLIAYIFLFLMTIPTASHAESNKIIKWVDKDGVTHYDDKPPMPESANKASVLNKEGITVKKIEEARIDAEAEQAAAKMTRHDSALLASYNSAEEIDIAKERNTRIDLIALDSLKAQLAAQKNTLVQHKKTMVQFVKRKQAVPADLIQQVKKTQADISATEKNITSKNIEIAAIQKRYDDDKARFLELKPRDYALVDIKNKRKNLAELENWRQEAQKRVDFYQSETLRFKRSNQAIPSNIADGLLSATRELARADEEIAATKLVIRKNEQSFSK
jgi:Domain of unknown function (DUF4124)